MSVVKSVERMASYWLLACDDFTIELEAPDAWSAYGDIVFSPAMHLVTRCCSVDFIEDTNGLYCSACGEFRSAHTSRPRPYYTQAGAVLAHRLNNRDLSHDPNVLGDWLELTTLTPLEQEIVRSTFGEQLETLIVALFKPYLDESHRVMLAHTVWA